MEQRAEADRNREACAISRLRRIDEKISSASAARKSIEQKAGIAARFRTIVNEDQSEGDERGSGKRRRTTGVRGEFRRGGNSQGPTEDRFEPDDLRRRIRPDDEQPERIQKMVVVLRDRVEDFIGAMQRLEVLQGPDFIEPEIAARAKEPKDKAGEREREDAPDLEKCSLRRAQLCWTGVSPGNSANGP